MIIVSIKINISSMWFTRWRFLFCQPEMNFTWWSSHRSPQAVRTNHAHIDVTLAQEWRPPSHCCRWLDSSTCSWKCDVLGHGQCPCRSHSPHYLRSNRAGSGRWWLHLEFDHSSPSSRTSRHWWHRHWSCHTRCGLYVGSIQANSGRSIYQPVPFVPLPHASCSGQQ